MEAIAARLGPGFDLYAGDGRILGARLVCSVCGARYPATILSRVQASVPLLSHPPAERDAVPIEEATRRALARSAAARVRDAAMGFDLRPQGRSRSRRRSRR